MAESTPERLTRLVALVGYLHDRPEVPVQEVADHFGVSTSQVLSDINLLWVSGTPGYLPDDLIDFSADALDRDVVTLTNPRGMGRPLRLGATETLALLVALRALRSVVPVSGATRDVIDALESKLKRVTGDMSRAAESIALELPAARDMADREVLIRAIDEGVRIRLRYVSGADEVTQREVSPLQLVSDGSRWFLRAWCHRVEAIRHFRLDRILEAHLTASAAVRADGRDAGAPAPDLSDAQLHVTLRVHTRARWALEQIPGASLTDGEDGAVTATFPVRDLDWVARLVMSIGPDVHDLQPDDARAEVLRRARDAVEADERLCSSP